MALDPLRRMVEAHVMAAERLHSDDTTVLVLSKGKTDTGRLWIYVCDDGPFGGAVRRSGGPPLLSTLAPYYAPAFRTVAIASPQWRAGRLSYLRASLWKGESDIRHHDRSLRHRLR